MSTIKCHQTTIMANLDNWKFEEISSLFKTQSFGYHKKSAGENSRDVRNVFMISRGHDQTSR